MTTVGRKAAPQWVWVSAPRVEWIRARTVSTGVVVIWLALVSGIVLVGVGLNLPSSHVPITRMGAVMAGLGAFWVLLSGVSLVAARTCARNGYLDVNTASSQRRALGVLWCIAIVCVMFAWFLEVVTLGGMTGPVPFTAGAAVYLAVLALLVVLGGVAFFTARKVLRLSP